LLLALLFASAPLARAASAPKLLLLAGTVVGPSVFAVGERATILRSDDNARSWTPAAILPSGGVGPTATLTGVAFAPDARHGWAVGHDALILGTADGGRTWQKTWQGENLSDSFLDVLALDARRVLAVGAYGLCVETKDGGETWTRRKLLNSDYHLNRLTRGPTGTLYLAGEHGTLLRSRDAGATWTPIDSPYDGSFYGILPLDGRTLVAHGLRGRIYRSTDDGDNWRVVPIDQRGLIAAAAKLKSNTVVFAGQARVFLVSRDYVQTADTWPAPIAAGISALLEMPDGTLLALGEAGATILALP
jgi:photosystem II stability/assembly factor-like uncharacterized protein